MGLWYAIDRAATKPHGNGKLETVCTGNWAENEQAWTSLQFVSAAAVVNLFMQYIFKTEILLFLLSTIQSKNLTVPSGVPKGSQSAPKGL